MIVRSLVAALMTLLIAVASVATWYSLYSHETDQIARVVESESYAARSRLVRDIDRLLQTLRNIQGYWKAFGQLPDDWWLQDAQMELGDYAGIKLLVWHDPSTDARFLRTADRPAFDYRPDDEEWRQYRDLLELAQAFDSEVMLGPDVAGSGTEIQVVMPERSGPARLIAIIDAREMLSGLLYDSSPGYLLSVSWDGVELYERGDPTDSPADAWEHGGLIRNSMNVVWRVTHAPGDELAQSMETPAISGVMVAGLVIAGLIGLLILENGRVKSRAAKAERAERKLAELNVDLERQIRERTRELEDRSADLLTVADSVGHDLRNPLNSISTNIELMELKFASALGGDGLEMLGRSRANVRRMGDILDRLLGLSALSNAEFRRERIDMEALVRELFDDLLNMEPGEAAELEIEELPPANADPTLTRTLLYNLLHNALKYSRDRDDRRVRVGCIMQGGVPAYFVEDNGVGFDGEAADRLFAAFERLPHDGRTDGLGLGLHIAARVVKRHEGDIRAESRAGSGATFFFTLQPAGEPGARDSKNLRTCPGNAGTE